MTDLTTLLARALMQTVSRFGWLRSDAASPGEEWLMNAQNILATPEGQRIAAVIEAAAAWRKADASDPALWPKPERDLAAAIDALLGDEA